DTGQLGPAEASFSRAIEALRPLADDAAVEVSIRRRAAANLAAAHHLQGNLYCQQHRPAEALAPYREALRLRATLLEQRFDEPAQRRDLAGFHRRLAEALQRLGRHDEARAEYRLAEAVQ